MANARLLLCRIYAAFARETTPNAKGVIAYPTAVRSSTTVVCVEAMILLAWGVMAPKTVV